MMQAHVYRGEVEAGGGCSYHKWPIDDKIVVLSSLSKKDNGSQLSTDFYTIFLDFILGFFIREDPLSPYQFIIVMEILSLIYKRAESLGWIKEFKIELACFGWDALVMRVSKSRTKHRINYIHE